MSQMIAQFHFLRPEWLIALLPLAILWWTLRQMGQKQSGWQSVLAGHLYNHIVISKNTSKTRYPFYLVALSWLVATLALAGPSWEKLPQPVYQLNAGKVVMLDMSLSMRATDITPDRLTRAKYKAIDLIQQAAEGDIGLVAYAGDAFTISPLSSDAQNLTTLLPSLSPEIMPVEGSDPYSGLKTSAELLKNAGFVEGDIFWITDGIEMAQVAELNKLIEQLPYRISILAVGTSQGAPIQLLDGDFLKDRSGAIVIPKLNSDVLQGIARSTGGTFSTITTDDSDIDRLLDLSLEQRDSKESQESKDKFGDKWEEAGPFLVLLLIPFAALAFRRGYLFCYVIGFIGLSFMPKPVQAMDWQDLWKTQNQQAAQAYQQGDLEQAAEQFNDPMWKGVAQYKNGDYQGALESFSQLEGTQALYNQANALAKLGALDEAIEAYEDVLQREPDHQDAAANKQLLEQVKQQQEQEQNQQQQDQQQNSDQDQQSQDQPEQSQEQQQSDSEQQNSESQQNPDSQQQNQQQQQQQKQDQQNQEQTEQKAESQNSQQSEQDDQQQESQSEQVEGSEPQQAELTDEQREQMQRMDNLLKKIPDDPAFLLKRKMMLENQLRKRQRMPKTTQRNW